MKRKSLILFLVFTFLIASFPVNAVEKEPILTKQWGVTMGDTSWAAFRWTATAEMSDSYIVTSVDETTTGVIRRINKKDGKTIWATKEQYTAFFGSPIIYKNTILLIGYTWSYDLNKNVVSLFQYDLNGKLTRSVLAYEYPNRDYIDLGEIFLDGDSIVYFYKEPRKDVDADYSADPAFAITIDLNAFKKVSEKDTTEMSTDEIDRITGGGSELVLEDLNSIYTEEGFETSISQLIFTDTNKYYIGELYSKNSGSLYGLLVKTDLNGKRLWAKKSRENDRGYYDGTYLGKGYFAVTSYNLSNDEMYPSGINNEIRIYDNDGNIVEIHDINEELNVLNNDIIQIRSYQDAVIVQALGCDAEGNYYSYMIRYANELYNIEKEVKGKGEVVVNKNAKPGEEVEFNVIPAEGYIVKEVTIIDEYGNIILPDGNKFIMPEGDVKIIAEFVPKVVENPKMGISNIIGIGILGILAIALIYIVFRRYTRFGNLN